MKYDLEDRTIKFGIDMLSFCRILYKDPLLRSISKQLIRGSTSVGANYFEAHNAVSRRDFKNKIGISRKEAKEVQYFLKVISNSLSSKLRVAHKRLSQEAKELNLILSKIFHSTKV